MFYHLLYPLASEIGAFNVIRYITFRTAAAALTALFISFIVGPPLIRALKRLEVGQPIREIGPDHQAKEGTPTMGGLLILLSLLVSVLLWSNLDNSYAWMVTGVTVPGSVQARLAWLQTSSPTGTVPTMPFKTSLLARLNDGLPLFGWP